MEKLYTNDSGHQMCNEGFLPYLQQVITDLLIAGTTSEDIEKYIAAFFDDCN